MDYNNYSYSNYDQSIDNNYSNYRDHGNFHYLRNGDKQSDDYFHLFPS